MLIVKHPHATDRSRHARLKRAAVAALLLAACVVLSACYMEPDRVVDSNNGLTVGDGGQTFDTVVTPTPSVTPTPTPAPTSAPTPASRPASDPSETAAFLAAAAQGKSADSTVMYSAQQLPVPAARKPPVARLDEPVAHQVAYDSWAAADLDETSTGMPALDVPVNPLFAANTSAADSEGGAAYSDYSDGHAGNGRIETEDYGTASSDYLNDPYAATPAPEYDPEAASAPAYTKSTGEERFADYYAEEKALRFSEFPQAVKVAFIAVIIALLGVIAFEGFQLFRGPTQTESETQQKEDDNQYLDINTLKGDPNDGDDE